MLIGTTYGGNGSTTFGLPDLRGRVPKGMGTGSGLPPYALGQFAGQESVPLVQNNIPQHTHQLVANGGLGTTDAPSGAVPAAGGSYAAAGDGTQLATTGVNSTGSSIPVPTLPPYLVINWCIALTGIFPSQG